MASISAIVITFNEEGNLKECLESLKWCDEIIVVDSNSSDKTTQIAGEFTKNIIIADKNTTTYGEKRNLGITKASGDWVLWIDADERITPKLEDEIKTTINREDAIDAYMINRKSFFINRFIKHSGWYPDYTLRLFRKSTGIKFNLLQVHESARFEGRTGKLKNDIIHYTVRSFEHYINKLNVYTTLSAEELHVKGKNASVIDIIFRPAFAFFKMYFLKLGILDGYMGLVLCSLSSIHVMVKYSKLYYLNKSN
jgi:glycosyltransferase involved in cell wall biosynthesis